MRNFSLVFCWFLLLLSSCNNGEIEKLKKEIDLHKELYEGSDSLFLIYLDGRSSVRSQITTILGSQIERSNNEVMFFKCQLSDRIQRKFFIQQYLCPGVRVRNAVGLQMNRNGQVLFEREVAEIDSLDSLIFKAFIFRSEYSKYISFDWNTSKNNPVPEDSIIKVFNQIERGYSLIYDSLGRKLFKKSLTKLSLIQLDSLKSIFPFRLELGNMTICSPPPLHNQ